MNAIGWVGATILALSSIPQMFKTVRDGHADGLSWAFLLLWFVGEVLSLIYMAPERNWPLIANYSVNLAILVVIGYYKMWPRSSRLVNTPSPNPFLLTPDQRSSITKKSGGEVG